MVGVSRDTFKMRMEYGTDGGGSSTVGIVGGFGRRFTSFLGCIQRLSGVRFVVYGYTGGSGGRSLFFSGSTSSSFGLPCVLCDSCLGCVGNRFSDASSRAGGC